jgi:hypothetical protein
MINKILFKQATFYTTVHTVHVNSERLENVHAFDEEYDKNFE